MYAYSQSPAYGPQSETTFFSEQGIQVTSTRFVVYGQMYPVNGITAVSPFTIPAQRAGLIIGACLCGLVAVFGLISLISDGSAASFLIFAAITAVLIAIAVRRKDNHGIVISTAGGQVRALASEDVALVHRVLSGLHQAVASRG